MQRALCLFLLLLFVPVPTLAQESNAAVQVLDDATGDYYAALRDGPGIEDPIPYYTFMDMDWLEVSESVDGFTFTLKVVDLEGPLDQSGAFTDGGYFWIHFRHHDWEYRLEIERPSGGQEITYFAVLQSKFQDADEWGFLFRDNTGVTWDMTDATISYFVERSDLADSRGAAPYPGRSFTDFWVVASQRSSSAESDFSGQTLQFPWQLGDRMPDTGLGEVAFNVQIGLDQTGSALLTSDEPFRASNGEATTFLYTVTATNTGDSTDTYSLEATGVSTTWTVEVPLPVLQLNAGESLAVPILATTPFGHSHGGTEDFILEMRSTTDDNSVGRIELGVRYLEIPQPAGHHDTVYLHSIANTPTASFNSAFVAAFQPSGSAYFNTFKDDPSDDDTAVSAFVIRDGPEDAAETGDFTWLIPLDPTLRMGMDFDMARLGTTSFSIESPGPMQDVTLDGAFVLRQGGSGAQSIRDAPKLATFGETGITWEPQSSKTFLLDVTPQEAGDYVDYSANNELWLVIELSGTGVSTFNQQTVPRLLPGASIQLPLLDYEDDISDAFNALTGATIKALGPAIRDANPGDVILFDVELTARDAAAGPYTLSLTGPQNGWASIPTGSDLQVSGTPTKATIMVEIPETAENGARADLFLQAVHATDGQRRGLIRLVVDVDTSQEWDDDREAAAMFLGDVDKGSPAPLVPALLGVVALAMVRRRMH